MEDATQTQQASEATSSSAVQPAPAVVKEKSMREKVSEAKAEMKGVPAPKTEPVKDAPVKADAPKSEPVAGDKKPEAKPKPSANERIGEITRKSKERERALLAEIAELKAKNIAKPDTTGMDATEAMKAEVMHTVKAEQNTEAITQRERALQEEADRRFSDSVHELFQEPAAREQFAKDYTENIQAIHDNEKELFAIFSESAVGPQILAEFFKDFIPRGTPEQQDMAQRKYAAWRAMSSENKRYYAAKVERNILQQRAGHSAPQAQTITQPAKSKFQGMPAPETSKNAPSGGDASFKGRVAAAKRNMLGV